jgi:uncharacterized protein (UPF0264 family)
MEKPPITRLLVSVRSAAEAETACTAGVDLVDVKEPARGSLGPADPQVVAAAARAVAGRVPMSVALGELRDAGPPAPFADGVDFVKYGMAGLARSNSWQTRWQAATASLPRGVAPVAVAYADWQQAVAPPPGAIVDVGQQLGCRVVLLDTYDKTRGPLTRYFDWRELEHWIRRLRARGLMSAVAGGLREQDIVRLLPLRPDYVAVRGAACGGNRAAPLDGLRVAGLVSLVRSANAPTAARSA